MWARKCTECGYIQEAKKPELSGISDSYANAKCRKCKSASLDYGHSNYVRDASGKIVRDHQPDDY